MLLVFKEVVEFDDMPVIEGPMDADLGLKLLWEGRKGEKEGSREGGRKGGRKRSQS